MDVHDVGDISTSTPLQDGMIMTIEPGLYIPISEEIPEQ
jgi:Xaa-Pro aminopeptidase